MAALMKSLRRSIVVADQSEFGRIGPIDRAAESPN
jgi:hypothetical protein